MGRRGIDGVDRLRNFPVHVRAASSSAGYSLLPIQWNRGPHGGAHDFVRSIWPPLPLVISVGRLSMVPWQSMHSMVVAARGFAVKQAVAVHVRIEVAIDALHPIGQVDILQVDRLGELLRIVVRDDLVVEVEQVALAVFLEHGAEDPAVAVVIGKLGVLQLRVQLGDPLQKIQVAPQPARGGGFGILRASPSTSSASETFCCALGYMNSPSVSWSHQV